MKENEKSKEDREKRSVYLAFSLPWRCSLVSWLFAPSLSAHSLDLQRGCEKREIPKRMRDGPKSTRGKREEEKRGRRTQLRARDVGQAWTMDHPVHERWRGGHASLVVVAVVVAVEVGERQGRLDRNIQRTIITIIHVEVLQVILLCQIRTRKREKVLDID